MYIYIYIEREREKDTFPMGIGVPRLEDSGSAGVEPAEIQIPISI